MISQNRQSILFVLVLAAAFLCGCTSPEHRQIFTHKTQYQSPLTEVDTAAAPKAYQFLFEDKALPTSRTGAVVKLSLEEAVVQALAHNQDLHVNKLNPIIAGTFEQIERGVFDPEIFAELGYNEERATEVARSTGTQFSVAGNEIEGVFGVRQSFPSGTTIEVAVEQDRSASNRAPEQQSARLGLSITQSLLRGFGPKVNLVQVQQKKLEMIASEYELRGFVETLLMETETAYWNYVLAQEKITIFERSLAVARQQRDETEQRIEVGILPKTEAATARAEVARREQALIDARSVMVEWRLRLMRLINLESGMVDPAPITTTSNPRLKPIPIGDPEDHLALAVRFRADLNEARLRLQRDQLETVLTRNGLLPKLDLFITLGRTGFDSTFPRSFRNLNDETYDFTVGVQLSHFVAGRAAKARDLGARLSRQQAVESVANLQQVVRFDVLLAINKAERTRQQIAATTVTRELQEQALAAEKERFNVGASTGLLVAQAQRDLLASQIAEIEAIINYRISLAELYYAEGSLLERRGIRLAAEDTD